MSNQGCVTGMLWASGFLISDSHSLIARYFFGFDALVSFSYNKEQRELRSDGSQRSMKMAENTKKEMHENPHLKEARDHFRSARRGMYKTWEKWIPEGVLEQHRAARKEMLMGLRSMLDYAIDRTEKRTEED